MLAIYHVFGSGDFFLETSSQREAALAAQDVANETGQPASVLMYFDGRTKITHYYPKERGCEKLIEFFHIPFLFILDCNQIFPGLFSALSVYGQNSVSGFLVSLKRIDGVLICFSG